MNDIFGFQSGGGGGTDPALALRVTVLEDNELKITYYEIISGTSGSVTIPTNATINEGEFGLSGNAVLSKIDGANKPTYQSPTTAGGSIVTATLNATTGAWVASGVYTDANVALIYSIKIKTVYQGTLNYDRIIDTVELSENYVPYVGATANVDLDTFSLNAKSLHVKGTSGAGHLGLKHQSANITASASESSIGANNLGNPVWKNDGNPIDALELQSNKNASGGYVGLTGFNPNFKDTTGTYLSYFTNSNTASRTYTFQDADGTVAFLSDITGSGTVPLNSVISQTNTPAGSPTTGDRYLVGTAPTGTWVGNANNIAEWNGSIWIYTVPVSGNTVFLTSTAQTLNFNGTSWSLGLASPVLQNGNTLGTSLNIGTNDAQSVIIKVNGITRNTNSTTVSTTQIGTTGTNAMYRLDSVGFRIGTIATIGTSNTKTFEVNGTTTLLTTVAGGVAITGSGVYPLYISSGASGVGTGSNTSAVMIEQSFSGLQSCIMLRNGAAGANGNGAGITTLIANSATANFKSGSLFIEMASITSTAEFSAFRCDIRKNGNIVQTFYSHGNGTGFGTATDFSRTTLPTAFVDTAASTTSQASLRIRSGVAPTSPNDGDIWYDGLFNFRTGMKILSSATSTDTAVRIDTVGMKIGTVADVGTANSVSFEILTSTANDKIRLGRNLFGGNVDGAAAQGGILFSRADGSYGASCGITTNNYILDIIGRNGVKFFDSSTMATANSEKASFDFGTTTNVSFNLGVGAKANTIGSSNVMRIYDITPSASGGTSAYIQSSRTYGGTNLATSLVLKNNSTTTVGTLTKTGLCVDMDLTTGTNVGIFTNAKLNGFGQTIQLGYAPNTNPTATVDIAASETTQASLRLRAGVAPTTPNDGDIWFDGTDLKMQVAGVTKTFTLI